MAVVFTDSGVSRDLAESLQGDEAGAAVEDWARGRGQDPLRLNTLWHGLHYILSGVTDERPGPGPLGQVIFTHHRLAFTAGRSDSPFWLLLPGGVGEVERAFAELDEAAVERRYADITNDRVVGIYWQDSFRGPSARQEIESALQSLKAFYQDRARGGEAVVNVIG